MKGKRGLKRRFDQAVQDVKGVARSHGASVATLYVAVKTLLKIPVVSSLLKGVFGGALLVRVRVLNSWMYLNLFDPGISYQLLVQGIREPAHVQQVQSALMPDMKGIDIGANIGYYVLLECQLIGSGGHVFCIEPAPSNIALLKKNIAENNLNDRVSCFQYLVGDKNGTERLYLSPAANSHSVSLATDRSIDVTMVTLDHFIATQRIEANEIDFLRMDIEGYEAIVLQHMGTLLVGRTKPLKLFIELHPAAYPSVGSTLAKVLDHLLGLGFVIQSIVEEGVEDEGGRRVDRIIEVGGAEELVERFGVWRDTRGQRGIWGFFEFSP